MKYKVVSSIGEGKEFMNGIEFDYEIDDESLGREVNCLGGKFTISQNGNILVLVNPDWVLSIQKQEEPEQEDNEFLVNRDYEIFLNDKVIKLNDTTRNNKGVSFKDFHDALKNEWKTVEMISGEPFPMTYNEEFNHLIFKNDWTLNDDGFKYLKDGSWGRESKDGRSI